MVSKAILRRPGMSAIKRRAQSVRSTYVRVKSNKRVRRAISVVEDLSNTLVRTLSTPSFVLVSLMVGAIVLSHLNDSQNSPITKFLDKHPNIPGASWVKANTEKFLGMMLLLPSVIVARPNLRLLVTVGLLTAVIVLPLMSVFEYAVASALILLYLRVSTKEAKFALMVLIVASIYFSASLHPKAPKQTRRSILDGDYDDYQSTGDSHEHPLDRAIRQASLNAANSQSEKKS